MSTILIVDDDPTDRENLVDLLKGESCDLQLATDGVQALQMLEKLQPDLILLDTRMPGLDGFEVCRRIRSMPPLAEVPIIILTTLSDHDSLLHAIEAGADVFLTKPADPRELIARVRAIIRLNRYRTLREQRENIHHMAERLVAAQEEERQRISRELHDDLGQALTTHQLAIHNLQEDLSLPVEVMFERLQSLYDQSYEIFVKVRRLARDLRPPVLDALGLKVAMQTYCTEFTRRTHLPVIFEAEAAVPKLADTYNITLYRALQEALTNVVKHAHASQVWVELSMEDETVCLTVQDNGVGFSEEKSVSKGIGLAGLRERITTVGGTLNLKSAPGRGTVLSVQFPLSENRSTRFTREMT